MVLFDGDIVLTKAQRRSIMSEDGVYSYSAVEGGRWPDGIIPYVIVDKTNTDNTTSNYKFKDFTEEQRKTIMDAIKLFNDSTCVKFVEREMHHEYYTKIVNELQYDSTTKIWTEKACTSQVGRTYAAKFGIDHKSVYGISHQSVNLATNCLLKPGGLGM